MATKKIPINKQDIETFMRFLNHEMYWVHTFKPTKEGITQKGDIKSLFEKDKNLLIKEIEALNGKGLVCMAINERPENQTKGADVDRLSTLVFDVDVRKELKKGYVSTPEHHKHALKVAEVLKNELKKLGFKTGLVVDSGNGAQVYCKINLDLKDGKHTILNKLADLEFNLRPKIEDDIVELDCITKDINRRMKIPGTMNKKDTEQVEDRVSRIIYENSMELEAQEEKNNEAFDSLPEVDNKTRLNTKTGLLEVGDTDESRSAFEYRKVLALLRQSKTKEQIYKEMGRYSKWATAPEAYKEITYNKAAGYVENIEIAEDVNESINVMNFRSLMDYKVESVKWLIKDQIPCGEVGFLAGKRGEGKTWIALKQALSLAAGKPVFNDEVPEKKRVLIIDEESGEGILAKRLQLLAEAEGIKQEELDLITISFTGLKLDKPDTAKYAQFLQIIDEFKPDLVIADCLQRVCSFDIDKENSLISGLFTGTVRPLIKKYGMSWLFIHHLRKSPTGMNSSSGDPLDEIRGGSELVNYARFVQSCSQPKHQSKNEDGSMMMVFKILKMSNSNLPEPKVLNFQPNHADPDKNTQIKIDYLGACDEVLKTEVRVANAIKEYLLEEQITGEFETKLVSSKDAEAKIGFKKTFISKGLKELVDDGFLEKVKRGVYMISGNAPAASESDSKLPYGSNKKSLEGQKADLLKTEDDINDENIQTGLDEKNKDIIDCPKCNAPIVKGKCIGGCQ